MIRRYHFLFATTLGTLGCVALFYFTGGRNTAPVWLTCWLVSINVVALGYYGFDKAQAKGKRRRVPEIVLHTLSAAGGSLGAYLGMRLFRHKTIKGKFRILFWCIVLLQTALAVWLVKTVWWS